jgi:hypothetical protein
MAQITAALVKELRDTHARRYGGLQEGARGSRRRHGQGRGLAAQEGHHQGGQLCSARPGRHRRCGDLLHPHGWQDRRPSRGQLPDRLRGAHRRLQELLQRHRDAHRRSRPVPAVRLGRGDSRRTHRARAQLPAEKAKESGKGKPDNIIAKIVDGAVSKWKKDICLLDQDFVKDPSKDIRTLQLELTAKTGEKITIRRFTRYALGDGLQKKEQDFAQEVAAQVAASTKA